MLDRLQQQSIGPKSQIVYDEPSKKEKEWQEVLSRCGIGRRFWDCTFKKMENKVIPQEVAGQYAKVKDYFAHIDENVKNGIGLILKGKVGTLKTSMAIAVIQEYVKAEKGSCFFVSMVSMLDDIFTMKDRNKDEWIRYEEKIRNTGILVIDDLGAEYHQEWVLSKVDSIICSRYNHMKPIIITTNLSNVELNGRYAERIIDRLASTSKIINFDGKSFRKDVE